MFRDLYEHQEWADSEVWRVVDASDAAKGDKRVRNLLAHLHETQQGFLTVWTGRELKFRGPNSFANAAEILERARDYHSRVFAFVDAAAEFDKPMVMPWATHFSPEAHATTLRDTMMQVPMHSTYHRGQVNARLRELEVKPPLVDYIAWIWKGRPAPAWP
jgi:uncharacterized damage-inducible protein DinB